MKFSISIAVVYVALAFVHILYYATGGYIDPIISCIFVAIIAVDSVIDCMREREIELLKNDIETLTARLKNEDYDEDRKWNQLRESMSKEWEAMRRRNGAVNELSGVFYQEDIKK